MLFDPDPNLRWLFCLTHPDDEISICAWIRRLQAQGNEVFLSWTHATPRREKEARANAEVLGVPADHLRFHGATDGSACEEIPELLPKFQAMLDEIKPDRVVCGAFEQGHLDHDTTNYLVSQTFFGPVLEVPFYHTYMTRLQILNRFSDPRGQEILELEVDEQDFKVEFARGYPSQNIWSILFWHEVSQVLQFRRPELKQTERMRLQTTFDFLTPNHLPALANRLRRHQSWLRWERAIHKAQESSDSHVG